MLCQTCESFLTDILHQSFDNWIRPLSEDPDVVAFGLGNHESIKSSEGEGCELRELFNRVRSLKTPGYETLSSGWQEKPASIRYQIDFEGEREDCSKWTFALVTDGPESSSISFEIFRPRSLRDSADHNGVHELGLPLAVSERPTAPDTINIIKSWIKQCLKGCNSNAEIGRAVLPTRVIDVGSCGGSEPPRLLISHGLVDRYLTLSHCWGTGERMTLVKGNIDAFQEELPFNSLSRTFQDAIEMTRLLGLRYVWVDALCIIQDDSEDWAKEAASMCNVYENAFFSISALAAEDTHTGFLHERVWPQVEVEVDGVVLGIRPKLDSLNNALKKSRLNNRAWCLQEHLLPRAILHIGHEQVFWECRRCEASEGSPDMAHPDDCSDPDNIFRLSKGKYGNFCRDWLGVVIEYNTRQVTWPSDRLPAIAGLAEQARKELDHVDYVEGLWSNDLHAGLLWKRNHISHTKYRFICLPSSSGKRPRKAIAASWSWASINNVVDWSIVKGYNIASLSPFDANFKGYRLQALQSSGCLQIEGFVQLGSCRYIRNPTAEVGEALFKSSRFLLNNEKLPCFVDYYNSPIPKRCFCLRIANWKPTSERQRRANCLSEIAAYLTIQWVQTDANSDKTYRRIGVGYDDAKKVDRIFSNVQRSCLPIV